MENNNHARPMTADKFWATDQQPDINPFAEPFEFAEAYATYRLQFERRQHQNSWMPTEDEWRRFPESKCAAMDSDGWVFMYEDNPVRRERFWAGTCAVLKRANPIINDWKKCKVARPEGV